MAEAEITRVDTAIDYKVESVLPGIHTRLNTLTAEMSRVGDFLTTFQRSLAVQWDDSLERKLEKSLNKAVPKAMSTMIVELGKQLQGVNLLPQSAPVEESDPSSSTSPNDESMSDHAEGLAGGEAIIPDACKQFTLQSRHRSLKSIWDEWHGIGLFKDRPIPGGIEKAEQLWKAKWRRHFEGRETKQFTRHRAVITAMKKVGGDFTHLEAVFGGHCKTSIAKMDTYLKQEGMVEKKKPRGKNAANTTNT